MQSKAHISFFIIIFFFIIGRTVYSQTIIPRFEHLSINDGLPHSSVYSILQDKKGFMWFGTPNGLCRYDGNELLGFKYSAEYTDDIVNNFVRGKMLEDKAGNIWYSNESGIYKWDVLKERVIKVRAFKKTEFGNVAFQSVALDTNGSLWLLNIVHGIFEFDIFSGNLKQYPLPSRIDYSTVRLAYNTVDEAGNIWLRIISKNDPYIVFNKTTHLYSVQLKDDPPHAIFFSKEKEVQAFEDRLVYKNLQSNQSHTVMKTINNKKIKFYSFDGARDKSDRLWMTARGKGLFYYDERNNRFQEYHHDNSKLKSLPFDLTTCLYIDRNQNLWIGIDGGGVARLDLKQPRFNLFPLSEGDYPVLSDYFTKCFFEDEKGGIWFGSHTNGLNILDNKTNTLINYRHEKNNPESLPGNIVASILKDKDGNMWIGSSGGISLFNKKKGSFKTIKLHDDPRLHPEVSIFVYSMIQMKNGDLLAATLAGLIKVTKQGDSYEGYYLDNNAFQKTLTTDVIEMPDRTIYATVPGFGLYELMPSGPGYSVSNIFLNGIDLRSVRVDEKDAGWLWVSTGKGLVHFNTTTKKYRLWDERNGLRNSYVYGSLEEGNGNLWISTNGGLSHFNRKQDRFENYTFQDGLQSNEFNTQAFYKSPAGVFYFGGIKGFNWFKPGPINNVHTKPRAAITRIEIEDRVFEKDSGYISNQKITTAYYNNDFNFQFAALDYTRPEANKVQYMLQGWDAGWITSFAKSVRYSNLLPGQYTLRVKVSNAEGVWSEEEKIYLIIQAPFWKQNWFRVVTVLLLIFAAILVTNRMSQLKTKRKLQLLEKRIAVDAERNRISADMHDEIGSGITHIALLSELIQTQHKGDIELKKDVQIISTSAHRLVQTMGEIIWALNPQNDTLENLLAYIREQAQLYFEPFDIEFTIAFPDEPPLLKLRNVERRNLYLVSKELLNNAMKHSQATAIHLSFEINKTGFCFTVNDNGIGMSGKQQRIGSNGIRNLEKRMRDIGGTIEWQPGNPGTLVSYRIPA